MTALAKAIVDIASLEVGVKEVGGNNLGPRIVIYQGATWLKPDDWPWCAAFTAWVLREAIKKTGSRITPCPDASAYGWEKWGKKNGWLVFEENATAEPGDFVTYDFSHIGIVEKDDDAFISTIEGNTSPKGARDSTTGDGVWRMRRARHLVRSFIRIP